MGQLNNLNMSVNKKTAEQPNSSNKNVDIKVSRTSRFRNNLGQVKSKSKYWKDKQFF